MDKVVSILAAKGLKEKHTKEDNLKIEHSISLGTLVEITDSSEDFVGVRLFVVSHSRLEDGQPSYDLSFDRNAQEQLEPLLEARKKHGTASGNEKVRLLTEGSITRFFRPQSLKVVLPNQ